MKKSLNKQNNNTIETCSIKVLCEFLNLHFFCILVVEKLPKTTEVKFKYLKSRLWGFSAVSQLQITPDQISELEIKWNPAGSRWETGGLEAKINKKKSSAAEHVRPRPPTVYWAALCSCSFKAPRSDTDDVEWRELMPQWIRCTAMRTLQHSIQVCVYVRPACVCVCVW